MKAAVEVVMVSNIWHFVTVVLFFATQEEATAKLVRAAEGATWLQKGANVNSRMVHGLKSACATLFLVVLSTYYVHYSSNAHNTLFLSMHACVGWQHSALLCIVRRARCTRETPPRCRRQDGI